MDAIGGVKSARVRFGTTVAAWTVSLRVLRPFQLTDETLTGVLAAVHDVQLDDLVEAMGARILGALPDEVRRVVDVEIEIREG